MSPISKKSLHPSKPKIKVVHLECGFQSFGNATTLVAKEGKIQLELFEAGILATHLELRRKVFVPFSNIKGFEMDFDYEMTLDKGDTTPKEDKVNKK